MKTLLLLAAIIILSTQLVFPPCGAAQTPTLTNSQFRTLLLGLRGKTEGWRKAVEQVDLEQLPLGYAHGKLIEQSKNQSLQWIDMVAIAADKATKSDSLSDEINLSFILGEAFHSLGDLATMLSEIDVSKGKAYELRNQWMVNIQGLSSGPVNDASQASLSFVMARAGYLQTHQR